MASEYVERFFHHGIILVEIHIECLFVQDVIDNAALQVFLQEMARLLDEQVSAAQAVFLGVADKFIHQVLLVEISRERLHIVILTQLRTVLVCIVKSELQYQAAHYRLLIIRGVIGRVFRNEDIWGDASTAIHLPAQGSVIDRASMLNAVLREELPMLVTTDEVLLIFRAAAHRIRLLYATPRRRIVTGYGQPYQAMVRELNLLLHQSLSERASSDNHGPVIVLQRSSQDFGGRGRPFVDEHHQGQLGILSRPIGIIVSAGRFASLGIDDELLLAQELIGDGHGGIEISTRIVPEVNHQVAESLLGELGQSHEQFGIGRLTEVLDANISRMLIQHIGGRYALLRYLATGHRIGQYLLALVTLHTYLHLSVLGSFQPVLRLIFGHHFSHEWLAVYGYYLVSRQNARTLGRAVLDNVLHAYGILPDDKLNAHARERAFQFIAGRLHLLGGHIH